MQEIEIQNLENNELVVKLQMELRPQLLNHTSIQIHQ